MAGHRLPIFFAVAQIAIMTLAFSANAQGVIYKAISPNPDVIAVNQSLDFPCWYCLANVSEGGGRYGATSSIMDLHVISSKDDVAFPRALVARIETECANCQPAAIQAQVRGLNENTSVFGANIEAYGAGRGTSLELNIGVAKGGYVLDVVPVRLPNGNSSTVDSIIKVEGQSGDERAAKINNYIDARIRPERALIILPSNQGPVTILETSDGRMKQVWGRDSRGAWKQTIYVDGAAMSDDTRISALQNQVDKLSASLRQHGLMP